MAKSNSSCIHHHIYTNYSAKDCNFCENCGCLVLINKDNFIYSIKPSDKNFSLDLDPLEIYGRMKEEIFNFYDHHKDLPLSAGYLMVRNGVIHFLKRTIKKYKFSNVTFVLSLTYVDLIMKHIPNFNLSNGPKLDLIAMCCFLLAIKFAENDPLVPDLLYLESSKYDFFSLKDIRLYEDYCVRSLNYKLAIFTACDILTFFLNHGIVFEGEIDTDEDSYLSEEEDLGKVNAIYFHAHKILHLFLLKDKSLLFNPLQIAMSVVLITREHFDLDDSLTNKFMNVYHYSRELLNECIIVFKQEYRSKPENLPEKNKNLNNTNKNVLANSLKLKKNFNLHKTDRPTGIGTSKQKFPTMKNIIDISEKKPKFTPLYSKIPDQMSIQALRRSSFAGFTRDKTKEMINLGKNEKVLIKSTNLLKFNNISNSITSNPAIKFNSNYNSAITKGYSASSSSLTKLKIMDFKNSYIISSSKKLPIISINSTLNSVTTTGSSFFARKKNFK